MKVYISTHSQSGRRQNLFTRDWMNDGKIAFHTDNNQNEDGGRVAQRMHKLIHFAEEVAKHPAGN
jgi:hypothetical protein